VAVLVAAVAGGGAAGGGGAAVNAAPGRPRVVLAHPLPGVVRQGENVVVEGRVTGDFTARPDCPDLRSRLAQLEGRGMAPRSARWRLLGQALFARRSFELYRKVPRRFRKGPLSLQTVIAYVGRRVAATRPTQSFVGPAPASCALPSPPANLPAGDGSIVGGASIEGGPFPGISQCESQAYTITATDFSGGVATTEEVPAGHSYTLVVPAGRYTLEASSCGMASVVTAGVQTSANAVCPVT
jgi:hypothetical protein